MSCTCNRLGILVFVLLPWWERRKPAPASGPVEGTWSLIGSPYWVEGELTVAAGHTLTIEPRVEVRFRGAYRLTVNAESAATTMLRGFNVLQSGSQMQVNVQNNGAQTWIQIVEAKRHEVVLHNSSAIGSTNDLQQDSQPVDNEPVKP